MICRRWCFGVTVVVAAVGLSGIPAAAQEPPAVEVPAVTLPAVEVPVPPGGPKVATPAISTPPITTPAVKTPPIQTPAGTVPSVSVPSVKVAPVTVSPVRTVPAQKAPPGGGAGEASKGADPPSASKPAETVASKPAETVAHRATPAVAVRDATARDGTRGAARPDSSARLTTRTHELAAPRHRRSSPVAPLIRGRAHREPAPTVRVREPRATPVSVPVADAADRHETSARPVIDGLGSALRPVPILMALALAGALCVAARLRRA
jgi:hypothetical protein